MAYCYGGYVYFAVNARFLTVDNAQYGILVQCSTPYSVLYEKYGLFTAVGTPCLVQPSNSGHYHDTMVYCPTSDGVFKVAGAGAHYLADNSPYRNLVSASEAGCVRGKTTYAPTILSNVVVSTPTTLLPTGQEEDGTAAIGYHYEPIHYLTYFFQATNTTDYPDATTGALPAEGTTGPTYEYTAGGRLASRTWRRLGANGSTRIITTNYYGFNDPVGADRHGDLVKVEYLNDPAGTPSVVYRFDRRGRRFEIEQSGVATTSLTYNDAGAQTGESRGGVAVSWGYNSLLQRDSLALSGVTGSYSVSYGYLGGGRLQTVTQGSSVVTYSYVEKSPLVGQITYAQNGTTRMVTAKQFDRLNRLESITSTPTGGLPLGDTYLYNQANQRVRAALPDGSYWVYTYDYLGQVISGKRYWQDGTPVAGQQYEYAFDDIGNRKTTGVGGDATGQGLRNATYTANKLNQYSQRTVPNYVDVLGIANPTTPVSVNGNTAYRKGDYFHYALGVDNSSAPQYPSVTVTNAYPPGQTNKGSVFVPKTPEAFGYDADGNLTNDGRWFLSWDAENRLVAMTNIPAVPDAAKMALVFNYDWQGRRISKTVYTNNAGAYVLSYSQRFLYDGWNLIAVLSPQSSVLQSFLWGTDLSGSLQGAGGVGGLLALSQISDSQILNSSFAAFDGNGNVLGLVNAADGATVAQYEYGPFGEVIRATGPMAKANPLRFSTKFQDGETDLLYYGYRYYSASLGSWGSRDPLEEQGGQNIYAFPVGDPVNNVDYLGQSGVLDYITKKPKSYRCGGFEWPINWKLKKTSQISSVVQHMQWKFEVYLADGQGPVDLRPGLGGLDPTLFASYWEAWDVRAKATTTSPPEDSWILKDMPFGDGTKGTVTIVGDAVYYPKVTLAMLIMSPYDFTTNPGPANSGFWSPNDPNLAGGTGSVTRTLTATWDCGCESNTKETKVTVKPK